MHETYGVGTETLRATVCKQRRAIPSTEREFQAFQAPRRQARHPRWVFIIALYALQSTVRLQVDGLPPPSNPYRRDPKLVFPVPREIPFRDPEGRPEMGRRSPGVELRDRSMGVADYELIGGN